MAILDARAPNSWLASPLLRLMARVLLEAGSPEEAAATLKRAVGIEEQIRSLPRDPALPGDAMPQVVLPQVRFLAPVPAGSAVACGLRLADVEDKGAGRQLLRLEAAARVEGSDKPAVVGEVLALIVA